MRHVFVALIEVRPQRRCEILDPTEVNGAAVRCYVPASDAASARSQLAKYLRSQYLDLVETEWLVREDKVEWEKPLDGIERDLIDEAQTGGKIVVGTFHSWGHNAPDADN
jgi:hypothetical protein